MKVALALVLTTLLPLSLALGWNWGDPRIHPANTIGVQLCWYRHFSHCKWIYPLEKETCYDVPYPMKHQLLSARAIGPMTHGCHFFKSRSCSGSALWIDTVGHRSIDDRVFNSFYCFRNTNYY